MSKQPRTKHYCLPKWEARIDAAEKRGRFLLRDVRAAGDWNLCACGEAMRLYPALANFKHDTAIGAPKGYAPEDQTLRDLGESFGGDVACHNFAAARHSLSLIGARLAQLDAERHRRKSHVIS